MVVVALVVMASLIEGVVVALKLMEVVVTSNWRRWW